MASSLACSAYSEFERQTPRPAGGNVVRALRWSPDGSCLLTASEDNVLRVFGLPEPVAAEACGVGAAGGSASEGEPGGGGSSGPLELSSALCISEGESVYDCCWYPLMSWAEPMTCCFLSTSRDHPVHLWDAYDGSLRANYVGYNHLDEVTPAYSAAFEPSGSHIYCGYERAIRVFDVTRPGRPIAEVKTTKTRRARDGQRGILSCLSFAPDGSLFAAGSFSGTTGVYTGGGARGSVRPQLVALLGEHTGGVTQVQWTRDGQYLLTAARHDPRVLCWDVRNTCAAVCAFEREASTNQRVGFDLSPDGATLVTGSKDGIVRALVRTVRAYSLYDPSAPPTILLRHCGCAAAVALHPFLPLLAMSAGERTFTLLEGEGEEGGAEGEGAEAKGAEAKGGVMTEAEGVVVAEGGVEAGSAGFGGLAGAKRRRQAEAIAGGPAVAAAAGTGTGTGAVEAAAGVEAVAVADAFKKERQSGMEVWRLPPWPEAAPAEAAAESVAAWGEEVAPAPAEAEAEAGEAAEPAAEKAEAETDSEDSEEDSDSDSDSDSESEGAAGGAPVAAAKDAAEIVSDADGGQAEGGEGGLGGGRTGGGGGGVESVADAAAVAAAEAVAEAATETTAAAAAETAPEAEKEAAEAAAAEAAALEAYRARVLGQAMLSWQAAL